MREDTHFLQVYAPLRVQLISLGVFMTDHDHELIKKSEVAKFCRISLSTINRLENLGFFPPRIQLGIRRVAWFKEDLINWLRSQKKPSPLVDRLISAKKGKKSKKNKCNEVA